MQYDGPIYDSVFDRADKNYYPANDPALRLVLIGQIYRDIQRLYLLIQEIPDEYGRRLLTKYAVIEWLSMDENMRRLFRGVGQGEPGYSLDGSHKKSLKEQQKTYRQSTDHFQQIFHPIRNKIGAHRDANIHLSVVAEHWDALEIDRLSEACSYVATAYNFLKSLPIYVWTKRGRDEQGREIIAIISPLRLDNQNTNETDDLGPL